MKKLLFTAVSALAMSAAIAADSTQFGVLPVNSGTKRTLVAVPWVEASTGGSDIAVSNLILTANLKVGDTLDALDGSGASLCQWTLTDNGSGVLYWKAPDNVVKGNNSVEPGVSASVMTVKRGSAVVLIRKGEGTDLTKPFYVMGQVAATAGSTTITAGSEKSPCWNMIGPPSTVAQGLNGGDHGATWKDSAPGATDRIYIPGANGLVTEVMYATPTDGGDKAWCSVEYTTEQISGLPPVKKAKLVSYANTIPVGTGFWYVSEGGHPTVTWKDVPTTNK